MTNTIFDLIETEPAKGKKGYFEIAEKAPQPKDNSFLDSIADFGKTIVKGSIEGATRLGKIMGPLSSYESITPEQELQKQSETLDELLPTKDSYGQRAVRRGLREVPTAISFPGSTLATLPRAIAAGFLGEGAKDLGAPEWAQTAAELTAYLGPDFTKKLIEKGKNKELISEGKKLGLSDEALAPLLQPEFKQKWLSKLSPRRGFTESALARSKEELGKARESIKKSPEAVKVIGEKQAEKLISGIDELLFEMPSSVREKITKDYSDLLSKPISGETIINFWSDINHAVGPNAKQLSLLKKPLRESLKEISPKMTKDFDLTNDLFSKYYKISERLKPTLTTDFLAASEAIGIVGALTLGHYPVLLNFAGEKTARRLAQQMLLNPRFQQLSNKMVDALNQNKFQMAKKMSDLLSHELKKVSPEISKELDALTIEDFKDLINHQHKE